MPKTILRSVIGWLIAAFGTTATYGLAADEAGTATVAKLESRLFDPMLDPSQIVELLKQLQDTDARAVATSELIEKGRGRQEQIIDFAARCEDLEARQACANIVAALDSAYRTTELGRQLRELYRQQTRELVPDYWQRFRKNPLDLRAVAMLIHGDPEVIHEWLGDRDNGRDRTRYLLLRLRELTKDDYVRRHLTDHTLARTKLVIGDVFPVHQRGTASGAHRIVGHATLNYLDAVSGGGNSDQASTPIPQLRYIRFYPRRTYLFRFRQPVGLGSEYHAFLAFRYCDYYVDPKTEQPGVSITERAVQTIDTPGQQLDVLPELKITFEHFSTLAAYDVFPTWAKAFIPSEYDERLRFRDRTPNESVPQLLPKPAAVVGVRPKTDRPLQITLPADVPSVVVLPPGLPLRANVNVRVAAEMLCDRLAQEIADGGFQVVDRQQLDAVLRERKLASDSKPPLLSFDAMVRVQVDDDQGDPQLRIRVVNLSTGNIVNEGAFSWPAQEENVASMAALCCAGVKKAAVEQPNTLSVRMPIETDVGRNPRLKSFGLRLAAVFQESLEQSEHIELVQHLEAASSSEESLLLLMGLTRLAGGRQFVPHADAAVQLRIREQDSVGQTFEETGLQLDVLVRQAPDYAEQPLVVRGRVKEFDNLIRQAWQELSGTLDRAEPGAAGRVLETMTVRRKAAEAELRAARTIPAFGENEQDALRRLAHTEAAVKLDPTYEDAAYEHVETLGNLSFEHYEKYQDTEMMWRLIDEVVRYRERFGDDVARSAEIQDNVVVAVRFTRLFKLVENQGVELNPQAIRGIDGLKRLLEIAAADDIGAFVGGSNDMLSAVYRGMRNRGVPLDERRQWLSCVLTDCERQYRGRGQSPVEGIELPVRVANQNYFLLRAAELLAEDGQVELVKTIIERLQSRLKRPRDLWDGDLTPKMRDVLIKLDDAALVERFDGWVERLKEVKELHLLSIEWPNLDVFDDIKERPIEPGNDIFRLAPENTMPPVPFTDIRYPSERQTFSPARMRPLVIANDRLYVIMNEYTVPGQTLAFVPLDKTGFPIGKAAGDQVHNVPAWDTIQLPPQPKLHDGFKVRDVRHLRGKLYFATESSGLLEFDPAGNQWKTYGPQQGLPSWTVLSLFPIDEDVIFCSTVVDQDSTTVHFTLNLATGEVTVVRKEKRRKRSWPEPGFVCHWRRGDRWLALTRNQLWHNLLRDECRWQRLSTRTGYGWTYPWRGIQAIAEVGNRRFFLRRGGLSEFDSDGTIVHSWRPQNEFHPGTFHWGMADIITPPDCPMPQWSESGAACGKYLVVFGGDEALVAFDPEADKWYGPLRGPDGHWAVGGESGVWLGGSNGLTYTDLNEIIKTATEVGRVMTTAEFRQRRDAMIDGLSTLDQAKLAFAQRDADRARQRLNTILDREPNHVETLLLMGHLHEFLVPRQAPKAITYYRRLAASDDRATKLTGMFFEFALHRKQRRWKAVVDVAEQILGQFPDLSKYVEEDVQAGLKYGRKQLRPAAKPTAQDGRATDLKKPSS